MTLLTHVMMIGSHGCLNRNVSSASLSNIMQRTLPPATSNVTIVKQKIDVDDVKEEVCEDDN